MKTFKQFLSEASSPNAQDDLEYAIGDGDLQGVKEALANGADPNGVDMDGDPILSSAINYDNIEIVKALLDAGADIGVQSERIGFMDHEGNTKDDPTVGPMEGDNVLHFASAEMTKFLLSRGAKAVLNARRGEGDGDTPLELAVNNGNVDKIKVLLDAGARIDVDEIVVNSGRNKQFVLEKLRAAGANV